MGSVCSLYDSAPIPVGNKSHYSSGLVKAPLTLHDFERLHVLGEGGFGITHKARNKVTGQIVALKLIKKQQAGMRPGDIRGIFEREVDVLGGLAHMHICHLLEAFEERDCFVLVLEYLRGGELFDRILKLSHYSEKVASEMVQQILNAVSYLHDQKIAHLDIKPENFVLAEPDDDASIKLIDFGLAVRIQEGKRDYPSCGTKVYKSPEMTDPNFRRDGEVLKKADAYSIGVLVYTMLVGKFPAYSRDQKMKFPMEIPLSEEAKDFMLKLTEYRHFKRLSLKEAQVHPWIMGKASDEQLSASVLAGLKQVQNVTVFQKLMAKVAANSLSLADRAKLEKNFHRLDRGRKGSISLQDLTELFASHSDELGAQDQSSALKKAEETFAILDENTDGTIDQKEWIQMNVLGALMNAGKEDGSVIDVSLNLKHLFDQLDENHDGTINYSEFARFLGEADDRTLRKAFTDADTNQSGGIDYKEFLAAVQGVAVMTTSSAESSLSAKAQWFLNSMSKQSMLDVDKKTEMSLSVEKDSEEDI